MQNKNIETTPIWDRRFNKRTALSRVIEYELKKPGAFGAWLTDLHVEHWIAFPKKYEDTDNATRGG